MSSSHEGRDSKPVAVAQESPKRPPIVYSSPGAFLKSFGQRWKSVWTRRFALSLLSGQVVSLCITCTNVTTTELVNRNWTLSTTQSFFLFVPNRSLHRVRQRPDPTFRYFALFVIYTPYTIYQCEPHSCDHSFLMDDVMTFARWVQGMA